ncbi:hypothetical protein [Legionella sp. CNM-4043-24]|uniref:hypothetical protein n=1 Tax=Legionella sp. CNM-4043-24 TaxID=3421646 RepID=UPI00403AD95E
MPQQHSDFFRAMQSTSVVDWLRSAELPGDADGSSSYDQLSDYLRECNDARFGIVSKLSEEDEWVRDATAATPLNERPPHDSPDIEANNALLRCLSRLRPIDYVLARISQAPERMTEFRQQLKHALATQIADMSNVVNRDDMGSDNKRARIRRIETDFNQMLVQALHQANLTEGCETKKDVEKLLFHYRNLSSLMVPARPMITLTYDSETRVLQRETQYPVTLKTKKQVETARALREVVRPYEHADKNSHTVRSVAEQQADSFFAHLIAAEDRALPAQARKTHLVGIKNAFIVKNELYFDRDDASGLNGPADRTLWLARTGSPAYVGPGESMETIRDQALENLEQIRMTATRLMPMPETARHAIPDDSDEDSILPACSSIDYMQPSRLKLHITCLNTNTSLQHQSTIVKSIEHAVSSVVGDEMSNLPTNAHGLTKPVEISDALYLDHDRKKPKGRAPLLKAERLDDVAQVILAAAKRPNTLSVVNCASGQDRTGTAIEKATQLWMSACYEEQELNTDKIDAMRAMGGNAAEITTHHVHGSPGMKNDSKANNTLGDRRTFSDVADSQYYLPSAGTNKKNRVRDVRFLRYAGMMAVDDYRQRLRAFHDSIVSLPCQTEQEKALFGAAVAVYESVRFLAGEQPRYLRPGSLAQLNQVLFHANAAITDSENPLHAQRLNELSHAVSGRESKAWKALGIALMVLGSLALAVVTPVLAASGVGVVAAVGAGVVGLAAIYTGLGFFNSNRQNGLAGTVANLSRQINIPEERSDSELSPLLVN